MSMIHMHLPIVTFGLLSLGATSLAAPAGPDVQLQKRENDSVALGTWDNIVRFEQFCAATYCSSQYQGSDDNQISCKDPLYDNATSCPLVEAANTTILTEWMNTGESGMTGYIAHDHTNKLTIVAFRGTQNIRNYWADIQVVLTDTDLCTNCSAHQGFWEAWNSSRPLVLPAVRHATRMEPHYDLVIVGHSLGGSLATLCAGDLRNRGYKLAVYAYGNPRTCNPQLADHISSQPGGTFRVTHLNDPVPKVPLAVMGFQHISPEYYINSATGASNASVLNLVGPLLGIDNPLGNIAQPFFPFSFAPHEWYIGNTTLCGAKAGQALPF